MRCSCGINIDQLRILFEKCISPCISFRIFLLLVMLTRYTSTDRSLSCCAQSFEGTPMTMKRQMRCETVSIVWSLSKKYLLFGEILKHFVCTLLLIIQCWANFLCFSVNASSLSLVSTASSLYSSQEDKHAHEVRKLKRELSEAQEKVQTLTNQLTTNVSDHNCFFFLLALLIFFLRMFLFHSYPA